MNWEERVIMAAVDGMAAEVGQGLDKSTVSFSETGLARAGTSLVLTGVRPEDIAGIKKTGREETHAGLLKC